MADDIGPYIKGVAPIGDRFVFPVGFLAKEGQIVEEWLGEIKVLKLKPDDVLVCSFPKSGTHWVGNLVTRLLHGVRYNDVVQVSPIEEATCTNWSKPSPRVLYSHLRPQWLPQEHLQTGGKVVLCLRNPKDAAVSYFHHMDRVGFVHPQNSWESFFQLFIRGQVPFGTFEDYVLEWDAAISGIKNLDVIVVFYEDLVADGFATLRQLQDHLGTNHSDEILKEILEECSFGKLQQQAKQYAKAEIITGLQDTSGKFVIYRKGKIGDWKNSFTVAQNETFDKVLQERLKGCRLIERLGLLSSTD